jgi:hypothetical protein
MTQPLRRALAFLALAALLTSPAQAQESFSADGPSRTGETAPTDNPTGFVETLQLDDGSAENSIGNNPNGASSQVFWFNRFTPPAADFPVGITEVQIQFGYTDANGVLQTGSVSSGDIIDIYIFSDDDDDPTNGATFETSLIGQTVGPVDATFQTFALPGEFRIDGPGDVLIGFVNRTTPPIEVFPATIDQTASQGRSWIVLYADANGTAVPVPDPPVVPPTGSQDLISIIDALGANLAGNWMIRGTYNANIPVELTRFDALTEGRDVVLQWETASETNNAGFEVQHERNGRFEEVAYVEGAGTTDVAQGYAHRVRGLAPGTHRFRLRQVDFDGAYEYSEPVEVEIDLDGQFALTSFAPNPVAGRATAQLTVDATQPVRVALYNVLGQRVRTLHDGPITAATPLTLTVDAGTLPSGVYVLRATGRSFAATQRVTVVR